MLTEADTRTAIRLALTFDDGPDERGTPAVLAALRDGGVQATFFVIAPAAERRPARVSQIREAGHAIGLHCDRHIRHGELTRDEVRRDTERALGRLDRLGISPELWRTPWGVCASWTRDLAREFDLRLVGWDVDTHDWRGDAAIEMFARTRERLTGDLVILAHDGIGPGARRGDCRETAAYVELVAAHSVDSSMELVTL